MNGKAKSMIFMTLTAMGVLASEIVLTRIFCVIFWYHFSFLILSTAMLGVGLGGLLIRSYSHHLDRFPQTRVMAATSLITGITLLIAFWIITHNPMHPSNPAQSTGTIALYTVFELIISTCILLVPYTFMGAALVYALQINKGRSALVYGAGLMGSGLGCLVALFGLNMWGGIESILMVSALMALTSLVIGWPDEKGVSGMGVGLACVILLIMPLADMLFPLKSPLGKPALKLAANDLAFSEWTSLAKVDIYNGAPESDDASSLWGLSSAFRGTFPERKTILIDSFARTDMVRHEDKPGYYQFLSYLPMYAVYAVSPVQPDVLVIGSGGGTDIRAALTFGADRIDAVEINPSIVKAMKGPFSEYTGGVYQDARVHVHQTDGRRFIETCPDTYDLIQLNNVATFSSTQAGAFSFAENYLYTREAFSRYLDHLTPDGTLCLTQWYLPSNTGYPRFSLRLFCLAMSSLADKGIANPENNILFFESKGFAVLLARKQAFSDRDINIITAIVAQKQYHMLYRPDKTIFSSMAFYSFVKTDNTPAWFSNYPMDVAPPTDNSPFYFETRKMRSVFRSDDAVSGYNRFDGQTILMVMVCEMMVMGLVLLWVSSRRGKARSGVFGWLYFASIGMGFMLVEVTFSQQLVLLFGNPASALSVVLLSMFLFSGLGSILAGNKRMRSAGVIALILAAVILGIHALFANAWIHALLGLNSSGIRVIATLTITAVPALFMGMAFPFGVHAIGNNDHFPLLGVYWAWNGVASIAGSIMAVILAISYGFNTAMATAAACYGLAACLLIPLQRH